MNPLLLNGALGDMDRPLVQSRPFRILVGGYINLNVIDGSAFFLAGVCAMCAQVPNIEIVLVSANPITKREVVTELDAYPNVRIVDPFVADNEEYRPLDSKASSMSRQEYASCIAAIFEAHDFDAAIIRDTEVGLMVSEQSTSFRSKGCVYVTGVTSIMDSVSAGVRDALNRFYELGVKLLFQTQDMLDRLNALEIHFDPSRVAILPPHVPEGDIVVLDREKHSSSSPCSFVYAGKFFPAWNVDMILAGFKAVSARSDVPMTLDVAGNQFRVDPKDPYFAANVKYLLENTPRINWHGGMTRKKTRQLISQADVGISWRRPSLDTSTELSTKVLEYGVMGLPTILNRTPAHEALLGADYPLFANSMTEFKDALVRASSNPDAYAEAKRSIYQASSRFTYSAVLPSLLEFLGNRPSEGGEGVYIPNANRHVSALQFDRYRKIEAVGAWMTFYPSNNGTVSQAEATEFFLEQRLEYELWNRFIGKDDHGGAVDDDSEESVSLLLDQLKGENERLKSRLGRLERKLKPAKKLFTALESLPFVRPLAAQVRRYWRAL